LLWKERASSMLAIANSHLDASLRSEVRVGLARVYCQLPLHSSAFLTCARASINHVYTKREKSTWQVRNGQTKRQQMSASFINQTRSLSLSLAPSCLSLIAASRLLLRNKYTSAKHVHGRSHSYAQIL